MNIQWSDNIPRLLLLSRQVANDWSKTEVDASCLLVAIIHKGDNAADILRQMGIDPVGDTAAIALKETGRPGYALKDNAEFYGDTQVNINFSVDGQRLLLKDTGSTATRYKIIRYRPNGVREQYRTLTPPEDALLTRLRQIAREYGIADTVIV